MIAALVGIWMFFFGGFSSFFGGTTS